MYDLIFTKMFRSILALSLRNGNISDKFIRNKSFKSNLSLDILYPNSVDLKPFKPPDNPEGKFSGFLFVNDFLTNFQI